MLYISRSWEGTPVRRRGREINGGGSMRSMRLGLALAAMSAVLLTACGGASQSAGGDISKASGTIRFSGWTSTPGEDELAAFHVKYPNITVTYEPVPKDFRTKLKAQLASGTEPDAFYVEQGDAA